ncbi:hypothetical protein HHI36_012922 [Cryptolaemus montrouzieri]|uniref:Uncharacterized protein n=1 Tax=Cryptolaemus montrouzieri TaxID=559131 RepID=A0ABD2NGF9_9CUCU
MVQAGISILIRKDLERHIADYNFISARLLTVTLLVMVLVDVYAPTDDSTLATKDTFYSQFSDVLAGIKPHQQILILENINARVCSTDDKKQVAIISEDDRKIYRLDLLQQESIKHLYQITLDSALAEAPPSEDIEEEYSNIKLALKRAAHEAFGYEQKRNIQKAPTWLTDEVKQSSDDKKKCYHR